MNGIDNHTGWPVAMWGVLVSIMPSASSILIWVSITVGVLQAMLTIKKLRK